MAAGDIIIPDNTLTVEIQQQLFANLRAMLEQDAKDPNDWEEVSSLVGVSSLPVFQVSGSVYKLVRVALSVLKGVDGSDGQDGQDGEDGADGKTPQITIGTVTKGDTASATLTADGVDDNGNPKFKLNLVLPKGDKGDTGATGETGAQGAQGDPGKNVKMGTVTVTSGQTPSGSFTQNGTDGEGNPIYDLSLVVQKGDNGKDPVFEQGTTTTLNPGEEAYVEVVSNGNTEEGNPKYTLNFGVPRGQQGAAGTGSGNVYAEGTGLESGKQYLFVPGANGSTTGTFVEYTAPVIPEQVQPDWNATEGKGAILNKPIIPTKTSDLQNDSDYKTGSQIATILLDYVQKVEGKGLSTEDFTTELKQKLQGLTNYNDTELQSKVTSLQSQLNTLLSGDASSAIESFNEIVAFLSGVEDTETLEGIIAGIGQQITNVQNSIPTKLSQLQNDDNTVKDASYVHTDNNYSNTEKQNVSDSLRLKEYTDVSNIGSLPATHYNMRYAYNSNSPKAINFASVSSVAEMQEFYLSIKNNTGSTITQPIPNGSGWQSDETSIKIEAGKTAGVSIKKEHGVMVVRV